MQVLACGASKSLAILALEASFRSRQERASFFIYELYFLRS